MVVYNSHLMVYVTEVFLHSLITVLCVEILISAWNIKRPASRLRFRYLALILPAALPLTYKLAHPSRAEDYFRENVAIFNGVQWLRLNIWNGLSLWHLALIIMGVTTFLFIFQEVVPAVSGGVGTHKSKKKLQPGEHPALEAALKSVTAGIKMPGLSDIDVYMIKDRNPILCASGLRRPYMVISDSLLELLDTEELKGALAHEMTHLVNNDHWKAWALLLLRALMFYNPVALAVFRSIINENEKVCDDAAVNLTGEPLAFALSLIKVYKACLSLHKEGVACPAGGRLHSVASSIESRSYRIRMEQRVKRIVREAMPDPVYYEEFRLGFLAGSLAVLLFFVV